MDLVRAHLKLARESEGKFNRGVISHLRDLTPQILFATDVQLRSLYSEASSARESYLSRHAVLEELEPIRTSRELAVPEVRGRISMRHSLSTFST